MWFLNGELCANVFGQRLHGNSYELWISFIWLVNWEVCVNVFAQKLYESVFMFCEYVKIIMIDIFVGIVALSTGKWLISFPYLNHCGMYQIFEWGDVPLPLK